MTPEWQQLQQVAAANLGSPTAFDPETLNPRAPAAQRYLAGAIAPGTPLAAGVRLDMRGSIKLSRWLPFRAHQLLIPRLGTVWAARVAGVISGSDHYVAGSGGMEWKLFGRLRIVETAGPDVTRSAAERAAGESIWVPTAIANNRTLTDLGPDRIGVTVDVDGYLVRLEHRLNDRGQLISSSFRRWGDPDNSGNWSQHPFGVEVTRMQTYGGVTIPAGGRAGWHFGTDRWDEGVFFRYEITAYEPVK